MFIYRIENVETGNGPYNPGGRYWCPPWLNTSGFGETPNVRFDVPQWNETQFCAFADPESMFAWFGGAVADLIDSGDYMVAVYDAPEDHVFMGRCQVSFIRDNEPIGAVLDSDTLYEAFPEAGTYDSPRDEYEAEQEAWEDEPCDCGYC